MKDYYSFFFFDTSAINVKKTHIFICLLNVTSFAALCLFCWILIIKMHDVNVSTKRREKNPLFFLLNIIFERFGINYNSPFNLCLLFLFLFFLFFLFERHQKQACWFIFRELCRGVCSPHHKKTATPKLKNTFKGDRFIRAKYNNRILYQHWWIN